MADAIINYRSGRGWLIFSGGHTSGSPIRAQALARAQAFGSVAYISSADDGGDALMDDMEDLGARSGYFIDLEYDAPGEIQSQLEVASLITIEVGSSIDTLLQGLSTEAVAGIQEAYERGAVVLVEGLASNIFGRWVVLDSGEIQDGLNWVDNAFIEPDSGGIEDSRAVQAIVAQFPDAVAINIKSGAALALGPEAQVEIWGQPQDVTISLGAGYESGS